MDPKSTSKYNIGKLQTTNNNMRVDSFFAYLQTGAKAVADATRAARITIRLIIVKELGTVIAELGQIVYCITDGPCC